MTEALVSVLIRSMGRPMLQAALDSIAGQLYPNIEVTVVAASGDANAMLARLRAQVFLQPSSE
jgi:hypothetical protein